MTNLARFLGHEVEPWDFLFRDFFNADGFFTPARQSQIKYPVDIYEDDESMNIEIAAAGIDKEDIEITETDGVLCVSYTKEDSEEDEKYLQRSIAKRSFSHGWRVSDKFDAKKIEASMDKGILKISIPRAEEKETIKNIIKIK